MLKGVTEMKRWLLLLTVLLLTACASNEYDGAPLTIAVIGDMPDIDNEHITFVPSSLQKWTVDADAVMITKSAFDEASDDRYIDTYKNSDVPIIFFDSPKRHFPFVNEGLTYSEEHREALIDGSHTTVYSFDKDTATEYASYFFVEDDEQAMYARLFEYVAK